MKPAVIPKRRRRAVNLTLDPDLVERAKGEAGNLSAVVEQLLREFVDHAERERLARAEAVQSTVDLWNEFNEKHGSIADEYSTL